MRILVVQQKTTQNHSQAVDFLAEEYPEAERLFVSDQNDMIQALNRESVNLVLIDASKDWKHSTGLLDTIRDHQPNLPVILIPPEPSATPVTLERELSQGRISLDMLHSTSPYIIIFIDPQGRVIQANQTFYQNSKIKPEEVIGRTLFDILPPGLANRRDSVLHQAILTGETVRFEDQGADGWWDYTIHPILNKQNQVVYVAVFMRDITDRKLLEEKLRRDQRIMQAMATAPHDIFVLLDRSGNIVMANERMAQAIGRSAAEVTGLSLWSLFPREINDPRRAVFEKVLKSGISERVEDKGKIGIYDTQVVPIHDDQGQVVQIAIMARDITERKHLEETLRRDQRTMLAIANAPNDIFVLLDLSGTILMTNEVMARSLDRQVDEIIGQCFWDLLPKPVADFRREVFDQVVRSGVPERVDDRGRLGVYDSRIIPIHDDEGQVAQVVIIARDITERKQTELALKASEERYRTLVETSPDGIAYQDLSGNLLFVNQQFAALYGYDGPEEIYNLGINGADLIAELDLERRKEKIRSVWQSESMRDATFTVHRKDGSLFQIEVNGSVVHDLEGKPTAIITICRDITERKRIELALQESEKHYRTLIETSPDGVIYYALDDNMDSHPLIINQRFASLFGYDNADEIIQLGLTESDLVAEQDHLRLREILQTGLQQGYVQDVIITAWRKDGSTFQLEANGAMVYDQNNKPQGFLGICRDVTERIRIQQELVRAQEMLEQRVLERTAELQALNRQLQKEVFLRKEAENRWKRHALHSETLARVASRVNTQLDINTVMKTICDEVVRAIPFPICSMSLYREEDDSLYIAGFTSKVTVNHFDIPPTPRPQFEEYVRQFGNIITIPDVAILPISAHLAPATTPNIRTLVIMPFYHMGEIMGSLNLASVGEIRLPNDEELDLLRAISDQAALSISNASLFKHVSDSQARLKILTERLVDVQEEEKRRLARELHDEIGQMLTSLSLNLEIVSRSVQAGEEKGGIQFELEVTRQQVKQLLEEVRDLSLNLLPAMLDDLGLLPTLLDYCQRYTSQTGILVNLSHRGLDERVPPQVEIAAYRIVQEALTNVARHAAVDQVDVRLWATSKQLGVQIEDQGVGFVLQEIESAYNSHGIAGMRERAVNCSGSLEIETSPGMGVCLTAEFPLNRPDQNPESK